jgi:PhnB protein
VVASPKNAPQSEKESAMPVNPPEGYHTVTPFVIVRDSVKFLDFLGRAFGAQELGRVVGEDGSIGHAEVRIGDSVVMMFDAKPHWPDTPAFLRLYVDDVDATFEGALEAGATTVTELGTMPWGDRAGRVRDPLGNLWWLMSRVEDLTEEEVGRRMSDPEYLEALKNAESADFFPR